ncbi:putative protein K02A2.6-like protein [Labeo rohita]|uniref:Reverse transcriptase RNase H-like domain-containing protein n=1 Tax=Labeo rohita TaxID=84645 RepID=A0A498M1Z2_LABRO|nr:putative protein K02A2.6-like protein [Labeo rohita]
MGRIFRSTGAIFVANGIDDEDEVEYLGHQVDAQGLHPTGTKVKAIEEAPEPRNVTELKAYLGLLNYYKFLPNLAMLLAPLHLLLRKDVQWLWKKPQKEVFKESKALLNSARVLVHYSSDSELILACDASPYGVGAVLSKRRKGESTEKPLGFMSRTLTAAEKRYSQLDKEGLAVIFGIQRFHKYLYGRAFALCTDHKPLINLFNETKAIPQMGSPRVQRWAVMLQAYQYNIVYKPGNYHQNADALSSLPIPGEGELDDTNDQMLMMDLMDDSPTKILKKQQKQKEGHDKSCKLRSFEVGDSVYVRNYSGGPKWIPAVVKSCTGPLSYKTALGQGQTVKRHVDQMRTRSTDEMFETVLPTEKEQDGGTTALSTADVVDARAGKEMSVLEKAQSQEVIVVEKPVIAGERQPTNPRRSAREKRSPARFKDYVA